MAFCRAIARRNGSHGSERGRGRRSIGTAIHASTAGVGTVAASAHAGPRLRSAMSGIAAAEVCFSTDVHLGTRSRLGIEMHSGNEDAASHGAHIGLPSKQPSLTLSMIQPRLFTIVCSTALGGFMIARSKIFQCGSILATALSFSTLSTAAGAHTAEQEQMCTSDAFRLCGSEI